MSTIGESLTKILKLEKQSKFNEEPVYYCKHCLSLKILNLDDSTSYCDPCGSTDIGVTDIHTWEKMYEEKYGKKFLNNK